jgi:hypothetical protein
MAPQVPGNPPRDWTVYFGLALLRIYYCGLSRCQQLMENSAYLLLNITLPASASKHCSSTIDLAKIRYLSSFGSINSILFLAICFWRDVQSLPILGSIIFDILFKFWGPRLLNRGVRNCQTASFIRLHPQLTWREYYCHRFISPAPPLIDQTWRESLLCSRALLPALPQVPR